MRKTLAVLLSLALVLSCAIGLFTIGSSATEKGYAETRADELWATAVKSTQVRFGPCPGYGTAYGFAENGDTNVALADKMPDYFTSGTYTFADGVLTINNPVFKDGAEVNITVANSGGAGLKVVLNGGDWYGSIRNDWNNSANSPILVTSNGYDVHAGTNAIRAISDMVLYGDVGIQATSDVSGDVLWVDNCAVGGDLVIGCTRPVVVNGKGNSPVKTTKSGKVIISDDADVTVNNTGAEKSVYGVSGIIVRDNASLTISTVYWEPIDATKGMEIADTASVTISRAGEDISLSIPATGTWTVTGTTDDGAHEYTAGAAIQNANNLTIVWTVENGGDEPGGDEPGGDEPGGDEPGGDSGDEDPANYASKKADELWATASKATQVRFGPGPGYGDAYGFANNGDTDVSLAEKMPAYFTSGTYTFVDGVLTINAPVFKENAVVNISVVESATCGPALKVVLNDGDWHGWIRSDWRSSSANGVVIVTSNGYDVIHNDGNALRSSSSLVLYGKVGVKVNTGAGGYDALIADKIGDIIIGCSRPVSIICAANGPAVENRGGSVIICGKANVTIKSTTVDPSHTNATCIKLTGAAANGGKVKVIENANLTLSTVATKPITTDGGNIPGDGVVLNSTGSLTIKAAETSVVIPVAGKWTVTGAGAKLNGTAITAADGVITAAAGDTITGSGDLTVVSVPNPSSPGTSDVTFAILSVVAVMAIVAAGAVVIAHRKISD